MKMKRILSILLCLCMAMAFAPAAFAEGGAEEEMNIINEEEIQGIITDYLSSKNIDPEKVSIGFCYTATGDEWFMNGDEWIYPASLYKIPLMMLLSEKVSSGELTQESNIGGLTVGQIEEYVIVYSNNDWAHTIRAYLGGDEVWRTEAMKYSKLEEAAYDPDYMTYCYFNAKYITDVIETLYAAPENYPNITECMGQAKPGEYLRTNLEGQFNIAQKYGSYIEPNGTWNNHAAGIIYTPNPIVVAVMTRNVDNYNAVIGNIAELLARYALTLDTRLEIFEQQKLAAQVAAEQAAADQAAAEQRAAEEAERAAAEKQAAEKAAAEEAAKEAARAKRQAALKKVVKLGLTALGIAVLAAAGAVVINKNMRKDAPRTDRAYDKRAIREYDDEQWDDEPEYIEKPASAKVKPVRNDITYRETVPAGGERVYSGAKPVREEAVRRETVPAKERGAYRTVTFSEEDFKEDNYPDDDEWTDDDQDEGTLFSKPAGRLSENGNSPKGSIRNFSRSLEQNDSAGQKKSAGSRSKKPVSVISSGTKKRGKHEL